MNTAMEHIQLAWLLTPDDSSVVVDEIAGPAVVEEIAGPAVVEEIAGPAVVEEIAGPVVVEEIAGPVVVEENAGPVVVEENAGPVVVELMVEVFTVEATQPFTASSPSHGGGLPATDIAKKSDRLVLFSASSFAQ